MVFWQQLSVITSLDRLVPAQGDPVDWDDVLALTQVASGAGARPAGVAARAAPGLLGTGPKPGAEPAVDVIPKTQRELTLKVG